jgi:hypothetical protein
MPEPATDAQIHATPPASPLRAIGFPGLAYLLALLALGACDESNAGAVKCQQAAYRVSQALSCFVVTPSGERADAQTAAAQSAECERYVKEFTAYGLTSHDAEKIQAASLDDFFRRYRGEGFCDYYTGRFGKS